MDAARGLMERQTRGLECETAMVEHPPHAALQVGNDILVMHAQNAPGQHGVPMAHEIEICSIVSREILDVVTEFLPLGEKLLEIAETARHRLAPHIDDPRVGQHQVDQADMPKLFGILSMKYGFPDR